MAAAKSKCIFFPPCCPVILLLLSFIPVINSRDLMSVVATAATADTISAKGLQLQQASSDISKQLSVGQQVANASAATNEVSKAKPVVLMSNNSTGEQSLPLQSSISGVAKTTSHSSIAAQSVITFTSVFFLGCAVIMSLHAWKKFSGKSFRMPLPYQYSALSQFDQDPDDELHDLEDNLHMLVEDSSSEGEDDVFPSSPLQQQQEEDADAPATLPVSEYTSIVSSSSSAPVVSNGRPTVSVSSLLDASDDEG